MCVSRSFRRNVRKNDFLRKMVSSGLLRGGGTWCAGRQLRAAAGAGVAAGGGAGWALKSHSWLLSHGLAGNWAQGGQWRTPVALSPGVGAPRLAHLLSLPLGPVAVPWTF